MKISYNWLQDFIDIDETPEEIGEVLTQTGLEVEGLETFEGVKGGLEGLIVGEVLECVKHPNADKLKLTKVDIGTDEPSQIVCGGPNVAQGQKVVIAPVNTTIYPTDGEPFRIKKAKIRGESSEGMICAEDEIGLGTSHDGVIVLDTKAKNGTPVKDIYNIQTDYVYEIGLTPNRGDGASHFGTARDLRAFYGRPLKKEDLADFEIKEDRPIDVSVEDKNGCPRYSGYTIRGIKVEESPDWLKQRLRAIGLEPINNVVDITNFVLHSLGQPLHAFDANQIKKNKIVVKTLNEGTKFFTLDEKERKLAQKDLMICDGDGNGMCIAGVFGGIKSGVTNETTDIFLESAYFSPDYIRATATHHGLSTDASFRYERGTDPEMTVYALKTATKLILDIAGGYVASKLVDIYPDPIKPVEIESKFSTFDKLIGKAIGNERIIEILHSLDITSKNVDDDSFLAVVPAYRSDVTREADLVEEVLRIYGFNNVELDDFIAASYLSPFEEITPNGLQKDLSYFLAGMGFSEILTNSITNQSYEEKLQLGTGEAVDLLNKSSEDLGIMKTSPLYTALESIRHNVNRRWTDLKLFEFAKTYTRYDGGYDESPKLCLYTTGDAHKESWMAENTPTFFQHISGPVYDLLERIGINQLNLSPAKENKTFDYSLRIKASGKLLGHIGKVKKSIARFFDLQQDIYYAELNWQHIVDSASRNVTYQALSKFPEVRRDLSLVLEKTVTYKEIEEISFNSEKKLLNRMNVFSVFEGEQIGEDKKAYAIAFYLQDKDKTLNDKQIDKCMSNLITNFESKLNATIRR